jgi:hypothetical protein
LAGVSSNARSSAMLWVAPSTVNEIVGIMPRLRFWLPV